MCPDDRARFLSGAVASGPVEDGGLTRHVERHGIQPCAAGTAQPRDKLSRSPDRPLPRSRKSGQNSTSRLLLVLPSKIAPARFAACNTATSSVGTFVANNERFDPSQAALYHLDRRQHARAIASDQTAEILSPLRARHPSSAPDILDQVSCMTHAAATIWNVRFLSA